jgi:hypothetical protein
MKPADKAEGDGNKALALNCATTMIAHGFGEKDVHLVGIILAAKSYYTLDMRDIVSMGIQDPGGEKYHAGDWGSNDGVTKKKAEHWLAVRTHTTKTALRNLIITMDPLVAWNEIKHCEHTVKFLGGERNKPRGDHSVLSSAMGRAPVGGGSLGTKLSGGIPEPSTGDCTRGAADHGNCQPDPGRGNTPTAY